MASWASLQLYLSHLLASQLWWSLAFLVSVLHLLEPNCCLEGWAVLGIVRALSQISIFRKLHFLAPFYKVTRYTWSNWLVNRSQTYWQEDWWCFPGIPRVFSCRWRNLVLLENTWCSLLVFFSTGNNVGFTSSFYVSSSKKDLLAASVI